MGRGKKGKISACRLEDCICKGDEKRSNAAEMTVLTQQLWILLLTLLKVLCLTLRESLLFFSEHKTSPAFCRPHSASSVCKTGIRKLHLSIYTARSSWQRLIRT